MPKLNKQDIENLPEVRIVLDPYAFEDYCSACDNFNNPDECPFYRRVDQFTEWKTIGCEDFID